MPGLAGADCRASSMPGSCPPSSWRSWVRWLAMLSFCRVSSSTWRCAMARCRSASDLVSFSSWLACAFAWVTIWSAFFLALPTSGLRVLIGFAPGLLGLRAGFGRPVLGGRGALFGLGHQLLRSGLRRGEPLGLLALGLLALGRQVDLELGLGLRPLSLALLQDPLSLAAHLVGLALGGGQDLVGFPLGRRLQLRHLTLGGGAQLGDVALDRGPLLCDLVVGRRPELG